jgi:hypothetical protein
LHALKTGLPERRLALLAERAAKPAPNGLLPLHLPVQPLTRATSALDLTASPPLQITVRSRNQNVRRALAVKRKKGQEIQQMSERWEKRHTTGCNEHSCTSGHLGKPCAFQNVCCAAQRRLLGPGELCMRHAYGQVADEEWAPVCGCGAHLNNRREELPLARRRREGRRCETEVPRSDAQMRWETLAQWQKNSE